MAMKEYTISVDIAKKSDYTGIQIFKKIPFIDKGKKLLNQQPVIKAKYNLGGMYKYQGKRYGDLVKNVGRIITNLNIEAIEKHDLIVDGTGVGEVVVDMMRDKGLLPTPIVFTGGDTSREVYAPYSDVFSKSKFSHSKMKVLKQINVPKKDMVDCAVNFLEQKRLSMSPNVTYKEDFIYQLSNFKGKINEKGNTKFEADKETIHDDLVACFLMFAWWEHYQEPREEKINNENYPFDKISNVMDNIKLL